MAAAVPVAIMAGQAIYGYVKNRQAKKAQQKAEAERGVALGGAQQVSDQLTQSGTGLTNMGLGPTAQGLNYYQTLLGGNRARMAQATAGTRAAITDQYRGAETSLEHSGLRGAAGEQARAELNRDRAARISGLTTGVQPTAAAAVTDIGTNLLGQGGQRLGAAGQLWSGLLGQGTLNRNYADANAQQSGKDFGSSLFDIASAAYGMYGSGRGASGGYRGVGTPGYPGDATSGVNSPIVGLQQTTQPRNNLSSGFVDPRTRQQQWYDMMSGRSLRDRNPYVMY